MSNPLTLPDALKATHAAVNQLRGLDATRKRQPEKLAQDPNWSKYRPEAQQAMLADGYANVRAEALGHIERIREHAGRFLATAGESLHERYLRTARRSDDPMLDTMQSILFELRAPRLTIPELATLASDAFARGDEAGAATLADVVRELSKRPINASNNAEVDARARVALAKRDFPLPAALEQEREQLEELRRAVRAAESTWGAIASGGTQPDLEAAVDRARSGEAPAAPTPAEMKAAVSTLPFTITEAPQPTTDAA